MVSTEKLVQVLNQTIQGRRYKKTVLNEKITQKEFEGMYKLCEKIVARDRKYNYLFHKIRMLGDMPEGMVI